MSDLELFHYGMPRRSGRYPWGSGENPRQGTVAYYQGRKSDSPRGTGRYKKYSKKNPEVYRQYREKYEELKAKGMTRAQIAKEMGMSMDRLTAVLSIEKNERYKRNIETAKKLHDEGLSNTEIAVRMNLPGGKSSESLVRSWLKKEQHKDPVQETADFLRRQVEEKKYIDVGESAHLSIYLDPDSKKPVGPSRLAAALEVLKDEGYTVTTIQVDTNNKMNKTSVKVLAPPGTTYKDVDAHKHEIKLIENYIPDKDVIESTTSLGVPPVKCISSDRVKIVYLEENGKDKDGLIELRRGVADLSLGDAAYAQVRIGVDDKYYMKGMAVYSDDLPSGVDVLYYSKKSQELSKHDVFKKMNTMKNENGEEVVNMENPFGAVIKKTEDLRYVPRTYTDENGKEQTSPINVVNEQGDWGDWSKTISAQMLSKQPLDTIRDRLTDTVEKRKMEYAEISSVDNPVVKKKLLEDFARSCDSTAVHLEALGFRNQAWHVILPITNMKENEIYAPNYQNGTKVALIRYPHGGVFEIPILTVNNDHNPAGDKMIGRRAPDAIGIHPTASAQLSGADNDGDTALVIPLYDDVHINAKKYLSELASFDHMELYSIDRTVEKKYKELKAKGQSNAEIAKELGMTREELTKTLKNTPKKITEGTKQTEMGKVTNLIMDMTVQHAPEHDIALATKHSMVIIDAYKHDLDYRKSYEDNEIERLKNTYQRHPDGSAGGATTLITKAGSETHVPTYREKIDPETGKILRIDKAKDNLYFKEKGEYHHKTQESTQMADTDDARTLISSYDSPVERAYADYANSMKNLANESRKEWINTKVPKADPAAAKAYANEVASLNAKLLLAKKNQPRERQAKIIADKRVEEEKARSDKELTDKQVRKIRAQALDKARLEVGAKRQPVEFTDKEWEAIQARAISPTTLKTLLNNANMDQVRDRATPKTARGISPAKEARIKAMAKSSKNLTLAEIAEDLGVSESTVKRVLAEG